MIKKSNTKIIVMFSLAFIFILLSITLLFLQKKDYTRTIMIYASLMDKENNENLQKVFSSIDNKLDLDNNNYLLVTDFYDDAKKIYKLTDDGIKKIDETSLDEKNESCLTNFLNYTYDNYKTDYYDLFFYSIDNQKKQSDKNNYITMETLENSLKNSVFNKDNKLEIVHLGVSFGNNFDLMNMLKDYSSYLSTSENILPFFTENDFFSSFNNLSVKDTTVTFWEKIADSYEEKALKECDGKCIDVTISLYDLNKVNEANDLLSKLFKELRENVNYDKIIKSINNARVSSDYDIMNLYKFVSNLQESSISTKIIDLFDEFVHSRDKKSIVVYYPYTNKSELDDYKLMCANDEYVNFISNILSNEPDIINYEVKLDDNMITIEKQKDNKYNLNVKLTNDVYEKLSSISYILFIKEGTSLIPIKYSSELPVDNSKINIELKLDSYKATDKSKGESIYIPLVVNETDKYFNYTFPVTFLTFDKEVSYSMYNSKITLIEKEDDKDFIVLTSLPVTNEKNDEFIPSSLTFKDFHGEFEKTLILNNSYDFSENNLNLNGYSTKLYLEFETDNIEIKKEDMCNECKYYIVLKLNNILNNVSYTNALLVK